ncbi:hypothetical protein C7U61_11055 [Rhizobium sp. JAB6]|nr:hypothetical protein C7U61_11055 [Rhizobium sp. JAB6]
MKETKPIGFRCHCFECSIEDEEANNGLSSDATETHQEGIKSGEGSPRLMPDVIGKLLFGT